MTGGDTGDEITLPNKRTLRMVGHGSTVPPPSFLICSDRGESCARHWDSCHTSGSLMLSPIIVWDGDGRLLMTCDVTSFKRKKWMNREGRKLRAYKAFYCNCAQYVYLNVMCSKRTFSAQHSFVTICCLSC